MDEQRQELMQRLEKAIQEMGKLVEEIIAKSMHALLHRKMELAGEVITDDGEIDFLEIHIDRLCLDLFKTNPTESQLRAITSIARASATLEAIGDLAVNISERTRYLSSEEVFKFDTKDLEEMSAYTQRMVHESILAFVHGDPYKARQICAQDNLVDTLNREIFDNMEKIMEQNPVMIRKALHYLLIARHLEKIADLATDICEEVVFRVEGKTIKHNVEEYRE